MRDLALLLDTKPGTVASLLERLASAGIPPVAGCFFPRLEGRIAHVAFDDHLAEQAREVIIDSGYTVLDERDVLIVDAMAGLSGVARKLADAGVGVYVAYFSPDGRAVIGTQDVERAKSVLGI
ncbi:MAG TPA: hypothetical protein VHM94_02260 [Acidimicrobiia bacterium]|jgi:hypothetical protein|nr:hypothetical protein [Acidimicrobiia bacterium]